MKKKKAATPATPAPASVRPKLHSFVSKANVEKIAKVVDRLVKVHGAVTPHDFLDAARVKSSPVHHLFEWDNAKAAEKFRLVQARQLLASYVVDVERDEKTTEVRGLQYVGSRGGYVPTDRVFADTDMATEVLLMAKREAISWFNRYNSLRSYADVAEVLGAIESSFIRISESRATTKSAAE